MVESQNRSDVNRAKPASSQPPPVHRKRIVALDGMRGLAILLVLVYHYCDQFFDAIQPGMDQFVAQIGRSMWFGVDVFFVLSGFLITGILCDTRNSKNYFRSFYGRRTVRIFPLYYASLILLCIILPRLNESFANPMLLKNQWWFWTYLSNFLFASEGSFGHTPGGYFWSVAVEEQFYLVWPFLVWMAGPRKLLPSISLLFVGSVVLRCVLVATGTSTTAVYVLPFTHLDAILLGSIVAVVMRIPERSLPTTRQLWIAATLSVLGLLVLGRRGHLYFWDKDVAAVGLTLLAVVSTCLLCAILKSAEDSPTTKFFRHPFLCSLGKYSYAIYLCHVPIGRAVEMLFYPSDHLVAGSILPALCGFILFAGLASWFVGLLSWHLFEKHFLSLKRYF